MSELAVLLGLIIILLTLFVVLVERKFLAYAQRRMGPAVMGRNGMFQIFLDLVKLLTKETFLIYKPTANLAPFFLAILYFLQLAFSYHFIFGPSMFLFDNTDSVIFYHLILILFSNIIFILVGFLSQSRYAILGTLRSIIHIISLDIFITLIYSLLIFVSQSPNFHDFILMQETYWFFFLFFPIVSSFLILLFLESKRAPFDHCETESEVVAGYLVEYSGGMLLIFFLVEYAHLVISAVHFIVFFLGGWFLLKPLFFLPTLFLIPNSTAFFIFFYLV